MVLLCGSRRGSRGNLEWCRREQSLSRSGLFLGQVSVVVCVTISLCPSDCGDLVWFGCILYSVDVIAVSVCIMFLSLAHELTKAVFKGCVDVTKEATTYINIEVMQNGRL